MSEANTSRSGLRTPDSGLERVGAPPTRVGVLALQGDFEDHLAAFRRLGTAVCEVRRASDLEGIDALVIPGGESSVMTRLLDERGLREALEERTAGSADRPPMALMGTCAGAIMLAREVEPWPGKPLALMDVGVRRNDYGRQVESFVTTVPVPVLGGEPLGAVFIRAPRIVRVGAGIEVLARLGEDPVVLLQDLPGRPLCLSLSFHPELRRDDRLHRYFLERLKARSASRAS